MSTKDDDSEQNDFDRPKIPASVAEEWIKLKRANQANEAKVTTITANNTQLGSFFVITSIK